MKRKIIIALFITLIISIFATFYACSKVEITGISLKGSGLTEDTLTITENSSTTLVATVEPLNAKSKVTWESYNTQIASVEDGVVTGISEGETKIAIKSGKYIREIDVTVNKYISLTAISFSESTLTVNNSVRKQLEYTIAPTNATVKVLVFTVIPANAGVTVTSAGIMEVAESVESGSVFTITAAGYNEKTVTAVLTLTVESYELEDIKLVENDFHTEITTITVPKNEPYRVLFQMPVPEKAIATGEKIETEWTSSNEEVCIVSDKGRLNFVSAGSATITMSAMGIVKTVEVIVTDEVSADFIGDYYIPANYLSQIGTLIAPSEDNGWQTLADFRDGGISAPDARYFVRQNYKYFTGPSSWFAGGGYCIEMGGWDNIHSGLEDDDLLGGGMPNLYMWTKVTLGVNATKVRSHFQYRESDSTFKYKLRFTIIDIMTKEIVHLSDWLIDTYNTDPNLSAGETYIESNIPLQFRGKTVLLILEYDDIDYTTDSILNGVDSVNIKYFSILNSEGTPVTNAMWVIGDSIMTVDYTGSMVQEIAEGTSHTLFRDTISGSTIASSSNIGIIDHIDMGYYVNNFEEFGAPQVILITRGCNDVYWSTQAGNPLTLGEVKSTNKAETYGAIRYMLNYFKTRYPNTKIIMCTAMYRYDCSEQIVTYNQNLKTICAEYSGVEVLDLYKESGITANNYISYLTDGIHPNKAGQTLLKGIYINYINNID